MKSWFDFSYGIFAMQVLHWLLCDIKLKNEHFQPISFNAIKNFITESEMFVVH